MSMDVGAKGDAKEMLEEVMERIGVFACLAK
jgi:hypothetical protein